MERKASHNADCRLALADVHAKAYGASCLQANPPTGLHIGQSLPDKCGMRHYMLALALLTGLAAVACDQKLSTLAGPTPNLEPTFVSVQSQIFETTDLAGRRACIGCHTNVGRTPAGGMNLTHDVAYDQIVNVASARKPGAIRVIPGDPENSYLIHKVAGLPGIVGIRMPFSGAPFLTDGQILIMKRWIAIGAPRN
jgi:hypothetical protein